MADQPHGGWTEEHQELAREHGFDSWEAWIESEEERLGRGICGARRTTKPGPCGYPPGRHTGHPGKGRCAKHGGASVKGPEHPAWKDGKTSLYAREGTPLAEAAGEFLAETQRMEDLSQEVAILRARMRLLCELASDGPVTAAGLLELTAGIRDAIREGDAKAVGELLQKIEAELRKAKNDAEAFEEFTKLSEQVRKLVESGVKITERQLQPVNEVRVYVMISRVAEVVLDFVVPGKTISERDRNEVVRRLEALSHDYRPSAN